MNYQSFILKLNKEQIFNILRLLNKHGLNSNVFQLNNINHINYLITYFLHSDIVLIFYNYYKSLPVDVQEPRYFNSIITHYKTIYKDYLRYNRINYQIS